MSDTDSSPPADPSSNTPVTDTGHTSPDVDWDPRPIIVFATPHAATAQTIRAAVTALGGRAVAAPTRQEFITAVDFWFPAGALVDADAYQQQAADWQKTIRRLKLRPHTRAVPIVLFGDLPAPLPGPDPDTGTDAAPPVDAIWTATQFANKLPDLIARLITPPTIYPDGWDAALSEKAQKGIKEFNARQYYEQHEWLEHAWMEETRPIRDMYQGILQVGVGFYHIEQGNWPGALKMLRRGLPRLRALPPVCQGLDIAELRAAAETIHREVTALGRARLHEFDTRRFPTIRIVTR
ncbi:MAG: DUF309 domain-containing protein [Litorilinea sp.]